MTRSRQRRIAVWMAVAAIAVPPAIWSVAELRALWQLDDYIDRCDDDTARDYIHDRAARAAYCDAAHDEVFGASDARSR
ncbi:MAG: hypothetical protein KDK10_11515 [Maritimibacter sp.]|nr:hypothetical protein [Maritimibacter sp.]